jgi:hypothetical protein
MNATKMKWIGAAVSLAGFLLMFGGSGQATPLTWALSGATLNDGSTASGSFTYDADTNAYSNYSISYTAGSIGAAITYGPSASIFPTTSASNLTLALGNINTITNYMNIAFDSNLTNAGGTIAISIDPGFSFSASSWECANCANTRLFTGGVVTATTNVPEPGTLALMGLGLAGLEFARRRKQKLAA